MSDEDSDGEVDYGEVDDYLDAYEYEYEEENVRSKPRGKRSKNRYGDARPLPAQLSPDQLGRPARAVKVDVYGQLFSSLQKEGEELREKELREKDTDKSFTLPQPPEIKSMKKEPVQKVPVRPSVNLDVGLVTRVLKNKLDNGKISDETYKSLVEELERRRGPPLKQRLSFQEREDKEKARILKYLLQINTSQMKDERRKEFEKIIKQLENEVSKSGFSNSRLYLDLENQVKKFQRQSPLKPSLVRKVDKPRKVPSNVRNIVVQKTKELDLEDTEEYLYDALKNDLKSYLNAVNIILLFGSPESKYGMASDMFRDKLKDKIYEPETIALGNLIEIIPEVFLNPELDSQQKTEFYNKLTSVIGNQRSILEKDIYVKIDDPTKRVPTQPLLPGSNIPKETLIKNSKDIKTICKNKDFETTKRSNIVVCKEGADLFCYDIEELIKIIATQESPLNPHTGKPLERYIVEKIRKRFPEELQNARGAAQM